HYANALLVAAGHDEKMPAGEEVIVTVGDAHVDDDWQPQVIGDVEQLLVRVAPVDVGAEAEGGGAALEAFGAQESTVERDVGLHGIDQVTDRGPVHSPGRQDLRHDGGAARGVPPGGELRPSVIEVRAHALGLRLNKVGDRR